MSVDFANNTTSYYCAGNNAMNGNYTITIANDLGANQDTRSWQILLLQDSIGNRTPTISYAGNNVPVGTGGTGNVAVSTAANSLTILTFKYVNGTGNLYYGSIVQ
jgi:hypothetical protein